MSLCRKGNLHKNEQMKNSFEKQQKSYTNKKQCAIIYKLKYVLKRKGDCQWAV